MHDKVWNYLAEEELTSELHSLRSRYEALHPDTELIVLTLPKNDPAERKKILARMAQIVSGEGE